MKVLHIISGYDGGIPSFVRNIAKAINSKKFRFDVISFTDYPTEFREDIALTNGLCLTMPRPKEVGLLDFIKKTREIINENGPYDLIECHMTGLYAVMFRYIARKQTKRFVLHAHAANDDLNNNSVNEIKRKLNRHLSVFVADQMTSCSKMASEFMFGSQSVQNKQIVHIPNGISPNQYFLDFTTEEKNILKASLKIPLNIPVLGHVGRFNTQKNHPFMVELIDYLARNDYNFVWVFIGTGEDEEDIKTEIYNRALDKHVRFLGRRENANELYQILDVLVLPSFYEGLPTVVVEAQAAGVNSVIANTITPEVDLDLNMVEFLSLEANMSKWKDAIDSAINREIPSSPARLDMMKDKGFTNEASALIYESFLRQNLKHFEIGHSIQQIV